MCGVTEIWSRGGELSELRREQEKTRKVQKWEEKGRLEFSWRFSIIELDRIRKARC